MNTDPINPDSEPIPEGWMLIRGLRLSNTARMNGIHFRIAQTPPQGGGRWIPVGIIIQTSDKEKWDGLMVLAEKRRKIKATWLSNQKPLR